MFSYIQSWLDILGIFDWRDVIELTVIALSLYAASIWLKRDATRPLLGIFYGYCSCIIVCKLIGLSTLTILLISSAPVFAVLAIIGHQDALQRRIVMYRRRVNVAQPQAHDWLEKLMRSGLIALNEGKEWFIVIEHHHDLHSLLTCPHVISAPISEEVLTIIRSSSHYHASALMWIKNTGIIHGINTQWNVLESTQWADASIKDLPIWKQDALLMTLKTDAIVCRAEPSKRAFDVIIAGKIFEQISATQALAFMKKHLHYQSTHEQEGKMYETSTSSHLEQRSP